MVVLIKVKSRIVGGALYDLLRAEMEDADIFLMDDFGSDGCHPDIILADAHNLCVKMNEHWANAKVLLIDTGLEKEEVVNLLLTNRLDGVLSTEMEPALIKKALTQVSDGQIWIDNCSLKAILSRAGSITASGQIRNISNREQQILDFIVKGFRNREIAEQLYLSEQTVKAHLGRIFKKYNVSSRTQLISLLTSSHHERFGSSHL